MSQSQGYSQAVGGEASQFGGYAQKHEFWLPATVAMLNKVQNDNDMMTLFGRDVQYASISLTGQITKVEKNDQSTKYTLQDCTGEITFPIWNNQEGADTREEIPEQAYCKVIGRVRWFANSASLSGYNIMRCQSYDEVTHHYYSVCHAYLESDKIAKTNGGAPGMAAKSATTGGTAGMTAMNFGSGGGEDEEALAGASESVKEVYRLILQHQTKNAQGASIEEIGQLLGRDIAGDIEYLMNEGQVYDTVSENWVKSTSSS